MAVSFEAIRYYRARWLRLFQRRGAANKTASPIRAFCRKRPSPPHLTEKLNTRFWALEADMPPILL